MRTAARATPGAEDPSDDPGGEGTGGSARPVAMLVALGIAAFSFAFQQTGIIPTIPTVRHQFHTSPAWAAWLLSGYLMVATVLSPALGRLADLRGHARMLLVSLGIFFLGAVGAATLPGLPALILCRAAQGAGGAVLPLSFALTRRHLDDRQARLAISGLMGAFGAGAVVGFGTGGLITEAVSWRLVFGCGAALTALSIVLVGVTVPRLEGSAEGTFDLAGAAWLGTASVAVLLALTVGPQTGWTSPVPILLLLAGTGAAAQWVRVELHRPHPLIDLRVLTNRAVLLVNGATVSLGWSRFVGYLLIAYLVSGPGAGQYGFAAGAVVTGLFLMPIGLGTMVGGPASGLAARRLAPELVMGVGFAVIAAGLAVLAEGLGSAGLVLVGAGLVGLGGGAVTQSTSAATTVAVPGEVAAASSALNSTVRRFAGGVGSQVSTIILATTAAAGGAGAGHGAAIGSTEGFVVAFGVAAAFAAGGAVLALGLRRFVA